MVFSEMYNSFFVDVDCIVRNIPWPQRNYFNAKP